MPEGREITVTIRLARWFAPALRLMAHAMAALVRMRLLTPDAAVERFEHLAYRLAPHAVRVAR